MTDNEIIETVNYCAKIKGVEDCDKCQSKIVCNDLQKENKEKDEMLKAQADTIFLYERVIKDKNAEIERLQGENDRVKSDCASQKYLVERMQQGHSAYVEQAKSEAVKEFWNTLVAKYESVNGQYVDRVMNYTAKDIIKEMNSNTYSIRKYGEVYEHKGYLDCDKKTEVWLYSDIDDLIDMDYDN